MGNSQDHFPLSSRSNKRFRLCAIVVGVLCLAGGAVQAQPDNSDLALRLRANVVRIQAPNRGTDENAFGFIVGQRGGQIYIVTAQHVIVPNDEPGVTAPARVKITFYSDQGKSYDAEVLGTHDTPHDLAVLRLPAPSGLFWIKESLAGPEMQKRGVHVWFIGRNSNWFVPVDPGVINSEHPTDDWRVEIERLPVRPGSSGGPLVANNGIVAMVQRGNEDDSFALTIDFIKTKVQDWNYPWDLVPAGAPPPRTPPTVSPPVLPPVSQPPSERTCSVSVRSSPSGAGISIDGQPRATTPSSVQLTAGKDYTLAVIEIGYRPWSTNINCATSSVTANLQRDSGAITLRYTGDYAGCSLLLAVKIGNKTVTPTSNLFAVQDVALGNQSYTIQGTISCPLLGYCSATGAGQINVTDGLTYDVSWRNTALAQCGVTLTPAFF